jgi:hypothetical protein
LNTLRPTEMGDDSYATPDQVADELQRIYGEVVASGIPREDTARLETLLARIQKEHHDFMQALPLVLNWTVMTRDYCRPAIVRYVRWLAAQRGKKEPEPKAGQSEEDAHEEGLVRLQAEYMVFLLKGRGAHYTHADVDQYRENLVKTLMQERRDFAAAVKAVEQDKEVVAEERRRRIVEQLSAARGGSSE